MEIIKNRIKEPKADIFFDVINYTVMLFVLCVSAYPLLIILSSSFSNPNALMSGKVWLLPVDFTIEGYKAVLNHEQIWAGYLLHRCRYLKDFGRRRCLGLVLLFNPAIFPPEIWHNHYGGMLFIAAWWGIWHIVSGLTVASLFRRKPLTE